MVRIEATPASGPFDVVLRLSGRLDPDTARECVCRLGAEPALGAARLVLVDIDGLELRHLAAEDLRAIAELEGPHPAPGVEAMAVVAGSEVGFGLARMLEAFSEDRLPPRFRVVRTAADAADWLSQPDDAL